jgi:trans-aconitate 2-methyltransferase
MEVGNAVISAPPARKAILYLYLTCILHFMTWDPRQYQRYSDERSRPFHELVDRIAIDPAAVERAVDLGCGPGHLTATLCDRWSKAHVIGVDNDANMLASAAALAHDRLSFGSGTVQGWRPAVPVDVVVSNATLQWIPGHLAMLPDLLTMVRPGGWFAFQVPANLNDPHHQEIRSLYRSAPWSDIPAVKALPDRTHSSHTATEYLDVLAPLCSHIDGWETTYLHILQGDDPVLEWVKGTALRPVFAALESVEARTEFLAELAPRLRTAYPSSAWGTPFPFKRIFVVAQRSAEL